MYFFVLFVVFIPCGRTCSAVLMCVPSPGCWHCSMLCSILFSSTVLCSLWGFLGNCSGVLSLQVTYVGVPTAFYRCCPLWEDCLTIVSNIRLLCTVSLLFIWFPLLVSLSVNVKFIKGNKHFFSFLSKWITLIISLIGPEECPSLMICWKNVDLLFAYLKSL